MAIGDWRLIAATDIDVHFWSFGKVEDVVSLYDPRTFGPSENYRCECGKYDGEQYANILCDRCGVKIWADAAAVRHERLGHINLACPCRHPITGELLDCFPVAPIAFRINDDRTPNALGEKYEQLVRANLAAKQALPPRDDAHAYYPAALNFDSSELGTAMSAILTGTTDAANDSVLALITAGLGDANPYLAPLIRAFGYAIKLDLTV